MSRVVFITGTGSGVGKTMVGALLARRISKLGRNVNVLKPVVSGFDPDDPFSSDPAVLAQAAGYDPLTAIEIVAPWRFEDPISPDMAAAREGRSIDYGQLVIFRERTIRAVRDWLIIEGVGGVMAPIASTRLNRDLIADLSQHRQVSVVLVAGSCLGTISHTLAALEALSAVSVLPEAVIVSESLEQPVSLAQTAAAISQYWPDGLVVPLPRQEEPEQWTGALDPVIRRLEEATRPY